MSSNLRRDDTSGRVGPHSAGRARSASLPHPSEDEARCRHAGERRPAYCHPVGGWLRRPSVRLRDRFEHAPGHQRRSGWSNVRLSRGRCGALSRSGSPGAIGCRAAHPRWRSGGDLARSRFAHGRQRQRLHIAREQRRACRRSLERLGQSGASAPGSGTCWPRTRCHAPPRCGPAAPRPAPCPAALASHCPRDAAPSRLPSSTCCACGLC